MNHPLSSIYTARLDFASIAGKNSRTAALRCGSYLLFRTAALRCKSLLLIAFLLLSLLLSSCQAPPIIIEQITPDPAPATDTLTITGYYNHQTCRFFLDARPTPSGELVHDDTGEPQSCQAENIVFDMKTFRFPVPDAPDLQGLRITLNQHLLNQDYHFTTNGFRLTSPGDYGTDFPPPTYLYTFATPGKQHLQVFFSEPDWQQILSTTDQLELAFQVAPCPQLQAPCLQLPVPCAQPEFTLLQGHYHPTTDLVNLQDLPDLTVPQFQFHLIDSLHTLRIRSIYHLLTEDFAVWSDTEDCRPFQNWDLSLIPATGYNLLEIKIDPPFLKCLRVGEEGFNFRVAILR